MRTLIAYATKGGVTEENANLIAEVLREKYSHDVTLANLRKETPDLTLYKNIIIGGGVRIGGIYKETLKFLENDFSDKKVVFFLSSQEAGGDKSYQSAIKKYIKKTLEKYPHVTPVAYEAFGGRMKILGKSFMDNTNPEKVKSWANELGKKLS